MQDLKEELIAAATGEAGLADIGFATAEFLAEDYGRLERWLEAGRHGEMSWMARDPLRRASADDWVKTVVVVAKEYPPIEFPEGAAKYAAYAEQDDYHVTMKKAMDVLTAMIRKRGGRAKRFVDTSAILERAWAVKAGLGFIGRNTMLLSRTHGPYVLLGAIFTDVEFESDAAGTGTCGECTRCIDICPTNALDEYGLDARKCISYLTIELKRPLTETEEAMTGEWEFGCDDCLTICPYTKFALSPIPATKRRVTRYK